MLGGPTEGLVIILPAEHLLLRWGAAQKMTRPRVSCQAFRLVVIVFHRGSKRLSRASWGTGKKGGPLAQIQDPVLWDRMEDIMALPRTAYMTDD